MNVGTQTQTRFMLQLLKKKMRRQEIYWRLWRKEREEKLYKPVNFKLL